MKHKININNSPNSEPNIALKKVNKPEKDAKNKINVKKKQKRIFFLLASYLLVFSTVAVGTIWLLNNHTAYHNQQFNPNANANFWNDYYQHHHQGDAPIDLTKVGDYFSKSTNVINCNITNDGTNKNVNFAIILNNIDNTLQKSKPPIEANSEQDTHDLLPNNFFTNVRYNPAVNFTVGDKKAAIADNSFIVPDEFNKTNNYVLNFATNNDATAFGIKNPNFNLKINIIVKNQIPINISQLSCNFPEKTISINNPNNATIDSIKTTWLIPEINDVFRTALSQKLNIDKNKIKTSYYEINFVDSTATKDFSKPVTVKFNIKSLSPNPWNFKGTYTGSMQVINSIADLSVMSELTKKIEAQYNTPDLTKNFQITLDNPQTGQHNTNNADKKLTQASLEFVNSQIITSVQAICQEYFHQNWQNLNINTTDYTISTSLQVNDDIFNKKLGKNFTITISANPTTFKLKNSLNNIKTIIHGHNKNNIYEKYTPKNFNLDGIWLKSGQDKDILQAGQHFYEQNSLLQNWITNQDSLLNTINNNSYNPVTNSFTGNFTINYKLDKSNSGSMSVNIATDIKGGKATNFWDLITKTKTIFLETDVSTTSNWNLNNVKLIFSSDVGFPTTDTTLYTFDLSSKFNGIAITDRATLTFPNFNCNIYYQQVS